MWPKYWSFNFNISPSKEHPGLISFRMDWLELLTVQGTLKSLFQHHSPKASILLHSAFFTVQLLHPYMATGKTIALTKWTFVGRVMSLLFNMLSRLVITFLPRSKCLLISWLQSPSPVILEAKNIKAATVSTLSHLFAMKWWDQMPWSSFSERWALSQLFHSPLSLSSSRWHHPYGRKWGGIKKPWMKVKEESEKVGLKLNVQKTKIMASGPHHFMENRWGNSVRLYFLGSKITADGDFSHEIKRCLLLGIEDMTNIDSIVKNRDITCQQKST